jgi:Immunoglobulin-like domain of bacterial spore germination/Sporulation and spore germination
MRIPAVCALVVAIGLASCDAPSRRQTQDTARTHPAFDTTRPAPAPTAAPVAAPARPDVEIDSVSRGNPVIVYGHARTFENAVSARVLDAHGALIQEVHGMSTGGEMGQHNPFALPVWLLRDPGTRITAQAFDYSAKDGAIIGLTSRVVDVPPARIAATVHLVSTDCSTKPFTRSVPPAAAPARLLAEMLVAGPIADEKRTGAYQAFPERSAVNTVTIRDSVLTVDFNEPLRHVGGACTARALREAITKTLMLPGVRQVVITSAGSRELALLP